ncbi:TIGR00725 family protein [Kitasatospora sp. NPDC059571]|uniref:TIGR00725 family protein n=1 Tax=Kitasatospora sp. NPDC059571 TaxID=3346871 RepID=UPI0036795A67
MAPGPRAAQLHLRAAGGTGVVRPRGDPPLSGGPPPEGPRYVGVIGPGEASAAQCAAALRVGGLLARAGAVVVCGGLGGVMAAVAQGAAEHGGTVVGLLPGRERAAGNPHLTVALATGLGELRNGVLVACCDALIAVGGSWGTLSEIALARRTGTPVLVLDGWTVAAADGGAPRDDVRRVATAAAGVAAALAAG